MSKREDLLLDELSRLYKENKRLVDIILGIDGSLLEEERIVYG